MVWESFSVADFDLWPFSALVDRGGDSGGSTPPLKNNVKGLLEMHYIFTKKFFPGAHASRPP